MHSVDSYNRIKQCDVILRLNISTSLYTLTTLHFSLFRNKTLTHFHLVTTSELLFYFCYLSIKTHIHTHTHTSPTLSDLTRRTNEQGFDSLLVTHTHTHTHTHIFFYLTTTTCCLFTSCSSSVFIQTNKKTRTKARCKVRCSSYSNT